jgi:hypothetical protein
MDMIRSIGDPLGAQSADLVMRAINHARAGEAEQFINCFSPALEFWMPGSTPISGHWHDREGFVGYATKVWSYLSVPVKLEVRSVVAAGEWVVTECVGHGVTRGGADYDNVYCLVWVVRDGRIARFVEYCDTALVESVLCREPSVG